MADEPDGIVMEVGNSEPDRTAPGAHDQAAGTGTERLDGGPSTRSNGRGRWHLVAWSVAALATVGVVTLAVTLTSGGDDTTIQTTTSAPGLVAAPDLPSHPVAHRWAVALEPEERLIGLGVHDDMVVALAVPPSTPEQRPRARVVALEAATGRVQWSRALEFPETASDDETLSWAPAVHVIGAAEVTTLTNLERSAVGSSPEPQWQVGLRATDGEIVWQDPYLGDIVTAHTGSDTLGVIAEDPFRDSDGDTPDEPVSTVVDLRDGRELFTTEGFPFPLPLEEGWISARRFHEQGWTLLDAAGAVTTEIASDSSPLAVGDTILAVQGSSVIGFDRDGTRQWERDLPTASTADEVETFSRLADLDDTTALVVTHRFAVDESFSEGTARLATVTTDGTITDLGPGAPGEVVLNHGFNLVTGSDTPVLACAFRSDPDLPLREANPTCPGALALVELDGTVRATSDQQVQAARFGGSWDRLGLATSAGLLVAEDGTLVLRSWSTLEARWELEFPEQVSPTDFLVAPGATGLAVGNLGVGADEPDLVTWAS